MNRFIYYFLIIAFVGGFYGAFAQETPPPTSNGLNPLQPTSSFSGPLHSQPNDQSPVIRALSPSDQIKILRNEGEWFEVDIVSERGIDFRGWLKGGLPTELKVPANREETLKTPKANPLLSSKYFWFWSGDVEEVAGLSMYIGTESLKFSPRGTPTSSTRTISGYNFFGFSVGSEASLTILETEMFNKEFRWLLNGNYHYSFFQVSFGNSPALPGEIQGASYRIHTQKFQVESFAELRAMRWNRGFMRVRLGPGYTTFDDSPDLKRTNRGNVVFTQLAFSGITSALEVESQFANNYRVTANFTPFWLTQVSENPDASTTGDLKMDGLTWLAKIKFQWRWTKNWSLDGLGEYFSGSAKHPGTSRRIDTNFTDVKIKLSSVRLLTGVTLHF